MNTSNIESLRIKLANLVQIREESKGAKIVKLQEYLRMSYDMLKDNYEELGAANEVYMEDWEMLLPKNDLKFKKFLFRFQKLLFDYLASFSTFVDHTRVFVNRINNMELKRDFDNVKKKKQVKEKTKFVKELHNYLHHIELPLVRAKIGYFQTFTDLKNNTVSGTCKDNLCLLKDELLKADEFRSISKDFLRKYPSREITIVTFDGNGFVDKCQAITEELYQWLNKKVGDLFHSEIIDFQKIENKIQKTSRELQEKQKKNLTNLLKKNQLKD